jgi:transcriptional regulator with XRE-family HTH domain
VPSEMRRLVTRVMGEAKRHSGKTAAFLLEIRPLISKQDYVENAVSAWLTGRTMPPAEVLLAAAKVSGVSLDELLFGESLLSRQDRLEKELGDLRQAIEGRASSLNSESR